MARREGTVTDPGGPGIPTGVVRKDPNNPVHFGGDPRSSGPYVDPRVNDPSAIRYAQSVETRRRPPAAIPRYTNPVADGPDLPIPRLDGDAVGGMPMSEQARQQRALPQPNFGDLIPAEPALGTAKPGIVDGTAHQQPPAPPPRSGGLVPPSGIRPTDLLPEQATHDPAFQTGGGAMFATNQPALAYKYGVIRNGEFIAPQRLKAAPGPAASPGAPQRSGTLRPETVDGLKALEAFQAKRQQAESGDQPAEEQRIEQEAQQGPAGGAGSTERALSEGDKKQLLDDMDDFDLSRLKSALFKDLLNNDEQKKIVEARLKPLDLTDLIVSGRVTQVVPVHPNVFEPEFQSYVVGEDLIVKRLIHEESVSLKPSDRYMLDKYNLMGLTIALRGINKRLFPDYRNEKGLFEEELFWAKYNIVSRFDFHMTASLLINWFWFDMRVRKLFKAETVGNG